MSKKNQIIPMILLFILFIGIMIAIFTSKNNPSDKSNLEISNKKKAETLEETIEENIPGLYDKNNSKCNENNSYENIDDYIKKYCAYECRYFIIKKI